MFNCSVTQFRLNKTPIIEQKFVKLESFLQIRSCVSLTFFSRARVSCVCELSFSCNSTATFAFCFRGGDANRAKMLDRDGVVYACVAVRVRRMRVTYAQIHAYRTHTHARAEQLHQYIDARRCRIGFDEVCCVLVLVVAWCGCVRASGVFVCVYVYRIEIETGPKGKWVLGVYGVSAFVLKLVTCLKRYFQ